MASTGYWVWSYGGEGGPLAVNTSNASHGVSVRARQNGFTVTDYVPICTVPPGIGTIWILTTDPGRVSVYGVTFAAGTACGCANEGIINPEMRADRTSCAPATPNARRVLPPAALLPLSRLRSGCLLPLWGCLLALLVMVPSLRPWGVYSSRAAAFRRALTGPHLPTARVPGPLSHPGGAR